MVAESVNEYLKKNVPAFPKATEKWICNGKKFSWGFPSQIFWSLGLLDSEAGPKNEIQILFFTKKFVFYDVLKACDDDFNNYSIPPSL